MIIICHGLKIRITIIIIKIYVDRAATGVRAVAEMASEQKAEKYHNLSSYQIFQPIAMENLGAFSSSSLEFLRELGRRLGSLSVAIQRFNSVLLHNGFTDDIPDL